MEVMVQRNLSPWYKGIPHVNISVYLRPVEVSDIYCIYSTYVVIHQLLVQYIFRNTMNTLNQTSKGVVYLVNNW